MSRYVHEPECLVGDTGGAHCDCARVPKTVTKTMTPMMRLRMPRELWERFEAARSEVLTTRHAHHAAQERLKAIRDEMQAVAEVRLGPEEEETT